MAALVTALWLFRLLPFWIPGPGLWGINHLLFLPTPWVGVYVVAGAAALLFLRPQAAGRLSSWWERAEALFPAPEDAGRRLIIAVAFLPLFWLGRLSVGHLGDGFAMISDIGGDLPVIFKWTETGAIRAVHLLYQLLPVEGLDGARLAYALVAVVSGVATVYFWTGLAGELGRTAGWRLTIFCLLLFSGWTLLFFGYAENYSIVWPFISAYLYFALRYLAGCSRIWPSLVALVLAGLMHIVSLILVPSLLYLLFARGALRTWTQKHQRLFVFGVAVAIVVLAAVVVMPAYRSLEFWAHFLPLFAGRPACPGYAVFSGSHLLDIANEVTLLIPVWPLLLYLVFLAPKRKPADPPEAHAVGGFLFVFSLGTALFLLLIDPKLGMGRDWDLLALAGLGPLLGLLYLMTRLNNVKTLLPVLAIWSLILVAPFIVTNLGHQSSLKYLSWLLDYHHPRTESGMVGLLKYYRETGDHVAGDSLNLRIKALYPRADVEDRALELAEAGDYQSALGIADSLCRADPYSSMPYNIRGLVHFYGGRHDSAAADLEQALRLAPESYRVLVNLALTYHRLGRFDEMLALLRRAQRLNPEFEKLHGALAMGFYSQGQYDSTLAYAEKLMISNPAHEGAYLLGGVSAHKLGNEGRAEELLSRYLALDPKGSERPVAVEILSLIRRDST